MKPEIMKSEYSRFKETVHGLFVKIHELTIQTDNDELKDVAANLIKNVNQPFLFVIVGEVKAGKSSLVNALLGETLCEAAPDPCTDTIQKIVHADEPYQKKLSPYLTEIGQDLDLLKEVAIVDTPGTNSIIDRHQEITERFIPESDLAIFVFPALNPYPKTSWELFKLVHHEWHKKIIFVLQQKDRATEYELKVNSERVVELCQERGVQDPKIFCVSAQQAMNNDPDHGVDAIWDYIKSTVTGGAHYLYKMESLLSTASLVLDKMRSELDLQQTALEQDRAERDRIMRALERGKETTTRDMLWLKGRLVDAYNREAMDVRRDFEDGLSAFNLFKQTFKGIFKRDNALKSWVDELHGRFTAKLTREADLVTREGTARVAETIVGFMESLLHDLKNSQTTAPLEPRSLNIASLTTQRLKVIDEIITNLFTILNDPALNDRLKPQGIKQMGEQAVIGSAITAVGAIIAGATHMIVFDVTGGLFATLGALLAIHTLTLKRSKIIDKFKKGFEEGRDKFDAELQEKLTHQVETIYTELGNAFLPFFDNINDREQKLRTLLENVNELSNTLEREKQRVREME